MRHISFTFKIDGIPTKINMRKHPRQRRFQIIVEKEITEYIISDVTNEVEYYEGPELHPMLQEKIPGYILQYFGKVRAIEKIGEDNYEDYDDY
jgi:hypothetical protein